MRDAQRALIRALAERYPRLVLLDGRSEPWASVTFSGERHVLRYAAGVDLDGIEEAEFDLSGPLLADIAATVNGAEITIEALTIHPC
jgi:hypothetical protein